MRIGVDIREFEKGQMTGIGRYLRNFLLYIQAEDQKNTYILYGNQKTDCPAEFHGMERRVIKEGSTLIWDQWRLPKALKKDQIDIFFSPYYKAPLGTSTKTIIVIHDLIHLVHPEYQTAAGFLQRWMYKMYLKILVWRAEQILTVSEYSKGLIASELGVASDKICVIPNSVDEAYQPTKDIQAVLGKYGLSSGYVFYCGNFNEHKNVERLIRAYAQLSDALKKKHPLVLAGRENNSSRTLQKIANDLRVKESVLFIGASQEGDLPVLYSGAECFVFPSLCEGFGLPPLEAMACGTPVITSNTTSLPEVVGEAAYTIDPRSEDALTGAMQEVLEDEVVRTQLHRKGLEQAKLFSLRRMGEGILSVFNIYEN